VTESRVDWWVILDREAEDRWRASLGQADIDEWCAAHGWKSTEVLSGSVMVSSLEATEHMPARVEVMAELTVRGDDGPIEDGRFPTRMAWAEYRRALPEGIAPVMRP
jgi:hypothetical protein